jgi:hypothetical protein
MTTQKEIDEMLINLLKSISQICDKTTSGNVSHNIATIKCKCRDMLQFCKNHPKNPWHFIADGDLPQVNKRCLFSFKDGFYIGFMRANKSIFFEDEISFFTDIYDIEYWMEIPKLPND